MQYDDTDIEVSSHSPYQMLPSIEHSASYLFFRSVSFFKKFLFRFFTLFPHTTDQFVLSKQSEHILVKFVKLLIFYQLSYYY